MEDVNQKIASLQEEIELLNSFDPRHTICAANFIIEIGLEEGHVSIAQKMEDGKWEVHRSIKAPEQLWAKSNVYYFDGWFLNRAATEEDKKIQGIFKDDRIWCKIEGLNKVARKDIDFFGVLFNIVITPMDPVAFVDYYNKVTGSEHRGFSLPAENFEGGPEEAVTQAIDFSSPSATAPIKERIKYLKKQILKLQCSQLPMKEAFILRAKNLIEECKDWNHMDKKDKDFVMWIGILCAFMLFCAICACIVE